jgi:hypothetical protein
VEKVDKNEVETRIKDSVEIEGREFRMAEDAEPDMDNDSFTEETL